MIEREMRREFKRLSAKRRERRVTTILECAIAGMFFALFVAGVIVASCGR